MFSQKLFGHILILCESLEVIICFLFKRHCKFNCYHNYDSIEYTNLKMNKSNLS